jgi:hypothetical protein
MGLRIIKVQSFFYTNSDDKDAGDGIAETYFCGYTKLCGNTGWARDIRFPEFRQHEGQEFEVDVPAERCSDMRYNMVMETSDGWDVTVHTYAWYSDGTKKRVGSATLEFGGRNRVNNVYFLTCR